MVTPMEGVKELGRFTLRGRTFVVYDVGVVQDTYRQTNRDLQLFFDRAFVKEYSAEVSRVRREYKHLVQ